MFEADRHAHRNPFALALCVLVACSDESDGGSRIQCQEEESQSAESRLQQKVIYGNDNRIEAEELLCTPLANSVLATSMLVDRFQVKVQPSGEVELLGGPLANQGLCEDERFASQKSAGFCSGVLIGRRTVLTAEHCVAALNSCERLRFIFGYRTEAGGQPSLTTRDVYACDSVTHAFASREGSPQPDIEIEYAVVRLDREVTVASPVPLASLPTPEPGEPVALIGHTEGLPAKADLNGVWQPATEPSDGALLPLKVDAFGGSSGGGLFDRQGRLVGILVAGSTDYFEDRSAGCFRANKLSQDGPETEFAVPVSYLWSALCEGSDPPAEVCEPAGRHSE